MSKIKETLVRIKLINSTTATKSVPLWKKEPLPKQIYPHELKNVNLDKPVIYFPQPFSFPGYPVILYL
ncbi:unnamed protein product [Euphydryas editha]|uniref:Uncharacterized protein n=1 Tax=Euphydryas editha TaxID=104508 RepID=A0AAU9TRS5_EUPED|nr:unnamed protein product [Euphydryas editha]